MIAGKSGAWGSRSVLLLGFVCTPLACGEADSDDKTPSSGGNAGSANQGSGGKAQGGTSSTRGGATANGGSTSGGNTQAGAHSEAGSASDNEGGADTRGAGGASGGTTSSEGGTTSSEGGAPQAGQGGGANEPAPDCDDHNACTRDHFDGSACRHEAVSDGTSCDDSNLCTLGDSCQAGTCRPGVARTGAAAVLGRVEAYGTGTPVAFGDDRVLFYDSLYYGRGRLTLARVVDGALQRVSSLSVKSIPSSPLFTAFGSLAAVTDGSTTVTIGGTPKQLRLFSVAQDGALSERGSVAVPGAIQPAVGNIVGRGTRLFMCANYSFFSAPNGSVHWFDVSDPDAPKLVASGELGVGCGSLAASEDGQRVYVNTTNGVRIADLSKWDGSSTTFSYETAPLVSENSGVYLRGNRVLTRSTDLLRVFDESTHELEVSFSVSGARSAALSDEFVFTQGVSAVSGGTQAFMTLHDLSGALADQRTVATFSYTTDITTKAVVGAAFAVSPFGGQLWLLSKAGFTAIDQRETARPESLYAANDGVHARSSTHWNRLDVSTPSAPRWVAGGPHGNDLVGIKLDGSLGAGALVREGTLAFSDTPDLVVITASLGHATSTTVQTTTADANERSVAGTLWSLPGGTAKLLKSGDSIYRLQSVGNSIHLQRFRMVDLEAGVSAAFFDVGIDTPATPFSNTLYVDAASGRAVVSYGYYAENVSVSKISVYDVRRATPVLIETVTLDGTPESMLLSGDALVWTAGGTLVFRQINGGETRRQAIDTGVSALLRFDGRTLYFSTGDRLRAVGVASDALLLDAPVNSRTSSLVETEHALVASGAGEVLTLSPACP
ncbi:MAG: hypothetical protein ACOY0T_15015 [Myxococcota bacterium]